MGNPAVTTSLFKRREDLKNVKTMEIDLDVGGRLGDLPKMRHNLQARELQDKINFDQLVCFPDARLMKLLHGIFHKSNKNFRGGNPDGRGSGGGGGWVVSSGGDGGWLMVGGG